MSADPPGRGAGDTQSDVPCCEPEDLTVTVRWGADADGGLRGQVVADNTGGRACRLPGKPAVTPVGVDGKPLPAQTVITLEMRHPGYVIVRPGERAVAPVGWRSWCGPPASDRAEVGWADHTVIARVYGPLEPECFPAAPDNLTSSWFTVDG